MSQNVRLRLTAAEATTIGWGLNRINQLHAFHKRWGKNPCSYPSNLFPRHYQGLPTSCPPQIAALLSAADKIIPRRNGGRVYLTLFELSACMLAVRETSRRVSHGHIKTSWGSRQHCQQLLRKLEKYRKRAKRVFVRRHGDAAYAVAARDWKATIQWVRTYYLFCGCRRHRGRLRQIYRMLIEDGIKVAEAGLAIRQRVVPDKKELWCLVRMAFREVRRGRNHFRVAEALCQPFGPTYFADFVIHRYHRPRGL